MYNDIFISYRNDPEGKAIGRAIKSILEKNNYSVYFNPDEQKNDTFPEELREAVLNCKDFVLLMTQGCLNRLLEDLPVDWLREEIIMAHEHEKHIIPILIDGVNLPDKRFTWPESIQFLYDRNYVVFPSDPDRYSSPPINYLESRLSALPEKGDQYRNAYNSNPRYNIVNDYTEIFEKANQGDLDSLYVLSIMYYYGFVDANGGSRRDYAKAYECFLKLSETTNQYQTFANNMIGHMYYAGTIPRDGQSYEESLKRHLKAVETMDSAAQHAAYMMSIGSGCEFDYESTVSFYENIAQRSDNSVKYNLAQFFCDYGEFKRTATLFQERKR